MSAVTRAVLVLAVALPLALFWQNWARAYPSHVHYKTTNHEYHPATRNCFSSFNENGTGTFRCQNHPAHTSTSTGIHYVNLAPWATPGAVGIALLGVALALSTAGRLRKPKGAAAS
jgi:hypothetical protein